MALFRGRTDEVFSTLQKVQRHITQNVVDVKPGVERPRQQTPPPGKETSTQRRSKSLMQSTEAVKQPVHVRSMQQAIASPVIVPAPISAPQSNENNRPGIHLGMDILVVIGLCLLLCVGIAATIGYWLGKGAGERQAKSVVVEESQLNFDKIIKGRILVVLSEDVNVEENSNKYSQQAAEFNKYFTQNPAMGILPQFGVRRNRDDRVQFVYGKQGEMFGIEKADRSVQIVQTKFVGKFPAIHWTDQ